MVINDAQSAAGALISDEKITGDSLLLDIGGYRLNLKSNSQALIDELRHYFSHVTGSNATDAVEMIAVESPAPELGLDFIDWKREPGKSGRKDSYFDLPDARLIRKVRTGMVFLQSEEHLVAAGPCLENPNQVINYINAQYMNWLQNQGWLICHAAALEHDGHALAIAGFSGGGKSTLMLKLMDQPGVNFLTNDRLFIHHKDQAVQALGIPKLPRINPGTLVHNAALQHLVSDEKRDYYLNLPPSELWDLEIKHDVMIDQVYGKGRITQQAKLSAFLVLNWQRDQDDPPSVQVFNASERPDLLSAIMKSPGPFYQYADGHFFTDEQSLEEASYVEMLKGITLYEVTGGIDFDALTKKCLELMS